MIAITNSAIAIHHGWMRAGGAGRRTTAVPENGDPCGTRGGSGMRRRWPVEPDLGRRRKRRRGRHLARLGRLLDLDRVNRLGRRDEIVHRDDRRDVDVDHRQRLVVRIALDVGARPREPPPARREQLRHRVDDRRVAERVALCPREASRSRAIAPAVW